jgi:hypothetical protein
VNDEYKVTIASAGGIPLLIALLASPSVIVQEAAVCALGSLSLNAKIGVTIAAAGDIRRFTALLASPSVDVLKFAAATLRNLGVHC